VVLLVLLVVVSSARRMNYSSVLENAGRLLTLVIKSPIDQIG